MRRKWLPIISIIFILVLAVQVTADDTEAPTIELISPETDTTDFYGDVIFKYKPNDNEEVYRCNLYLNEDKVRTSSEVPKDSENTFTHNIMVGTYKWSIECLDGANNIRRTDNRTLTLVEDTESPNITIQNFIETVKSTNVEFNYTVVDNASGIDNCELIVDDEIKTTSTSINENVTQHFSYSIDEGEWMWKIKCTDNAGNYKVSDTAQITVMRPPSIEIISPTNNFETDADTIIFNYKPSSTRDISKCSLYIAGQKNQTTFGIAENEENNFELTRLPSMNVLWQIECTDEEELAENSTEYELKVTSTEILESGPPKIMLVHPVDTSIVDGAIFSYKTTTEFLDVTICELFIDDIWNETDADVERDVQQDYGFITIEDGRHSWYVKCMDTRGQETYSDNATFIIVDKLPDPVKEISPDLEPEETEEKITKTIADTLGKTKTQKAIRILFFLLLPLILVITILRKELAKTQYSSYSRRY